MTNNTVLKRTLTTLMAFTMLIITVCGFTATKASAAVDKKLVQTISDENATAYIYEYPDGTHGGIIELHKTFTKENPLTKINGVKLSEIIKFEDGGFISQFYTYTNVNPWIYDYGVYVYGHGPSGFWAEGHMIFSDETGDDYSLILYLNKYGGHTVDYNSEKPTITKFEWFSTD